MCSRLTERFDCDLQIDIVKAKLPPFHQHTTIEGYQYCTTSDWAFQLLISENFSSFVLAIGCTAVAIHCKGSVGLKIFHFHVRDIMEDAILKVHACVLLEVLSLNSLVHYFHITMIYLSLKGWKLITFKLAQCELCCDFVSSLHATL